MPTRRHARLGRHCTRLGRHCTRLRCARAGLELRRVPDESRWRSRRRRSMRRRVQHRGDTRRRRTDGAGDSRGTGSSCSGGLHDNTARSHHNCRRRRMLRHHYPRIRELPGWRRQDSAGVASPTSTTSTSTLSSCGRRSDARATTTVNAHLRSRRRVRVSGAGGTRAASSRVHGIRVISYPVNPASATTFA